MLANMSMDCGANIKNAGGYSDVQFGFENIKCCYNCVLLAQSHKYVTKEAKVKLKVKMNTWSKIGLCQKLDHEVELDNFIGVNNDTMVAEELTGNLYHKSLQKKIRHLVTMTF